MKTVIKGLTASVIVTLATIGTASADFNRTSDTLVRVDRTVIDYSVNDPATANSGPSNAFTNVASKDRNFYRNSSRERAAEVLLSVDDIKNYLAVPK